MSRKLTESERRYRYDDMVTTNQLINEYGWSKGLIEKHKPHKATTAYNYRAPLYPVVLFDRKDVERIMNTDEFQKDFERLEIRRGHIKTGPYTEELSRHMAEEKKQMSDKRQLERKLKYVKRLMSIEDESIDHDELIVKCNTFYGQLSEENRELISYRIEGKTLEECSKIYGVTRQAINNREKRIIAKFKKLIEKEK